MMGEVVFLLEEPSMKALLEVLLPRVVPDLRCVLVPHEGKQDLVKSIPRKLRGWRTPGVQFIVVHDQDSADCHDLKARLLACVPAHRRGDTVIRIACRELEAWILGDLDALARAFDAPNVAGIGVKARFRNPDTVVSPSREVRALIPSYQKVSGARRVAEFLDPDRNVSRSFQTFLAAVRRFAGTLAEAGT